jgi:hypothetical protein
MFKILPSRNNTEPANSDEYIEKNWWCNKVLKQILARLGREDNKVRKEDQVRTIPKEYTLDG